VFLIFIGPAICQDARNVTEPSFPPVCTRLAAAMSNVIETTPDTARIQDALNACPSGQAVALQSSGANLFFLMGPIQLPTGVTLIVDAGVTVFASRNPRDYDSDSRQQCGTIQSTSSGCLPLISATRADGAGVMGYGTIDGRGQLPMMPGGVAGTTTWWDLGNQANAQSRSQNNFRLIVVTNTNGFTLYKITLKNSPNFHVVLNTSTNITAWGIKIVAPYDTPNTDGIDPLYSSNVTITNSWISTGDDNIALNGSQPGAFNITAVNNWFGDGHGASIGSFTTSGVSNVLFDHITIAANAANGNQNGIRIKSDVSRGGLVRNITYSNICMKNVRKPIVIDPFYTAGATGNLVPQYKDITIRNVHATTEGTVKIQGHDAGALTTILLDNVLVDGIKTSDVTAQWAAITTGPGDVNFGNLLQGTGVSIVRNIDFVATPPYNCPAQVFSPVGAELFAGPSAGTVFVQVFATKAVPYQTYLANLRVNPNASLELPAPTGTVTLSDGSQAVASAPLDASGLTAFSIAGSHILTASYSGDSNYAPITFGKLAVGLDPPRISTNGVVNAASFTHQPGIAPGSLFTVFGENLGPTMAAQAGGYPLSTSLGGTSVRVTVDGGVYDAWMLFASAGQVNAILPSNVPSGAAQVTVTYQGQSSAPAPVTILPTAVGVFAVAQNVASATDYPLN
jgi:polygalacturonase